MLSLRYKLSPRLKLWLGFAWCPFLTWICFGAQILLVIGVEAAFPRLLYAPSPLLLVFMVLSWCACWACVAACCGFGAAFFWTNLTPQSGNNAAFVFWSIALAWSPTLISGFAALLFLLPFLIFVALYCFGLERGILFWNSRSPNQWLGDFSNPDVGAEEPLTLRP